MNFRFPQQASLPRLLVLLLAMLVALLSNLTLLPALLISVKPKLRAG